MGTLEDEAAIRKLVGRYCDAVARLDANDWAATWAEDAEWHLFGQPNRGRDAIVALFQKLTADIAVVLQFAGEGVIEVDGDHASGRWHIQELARGKDGRALLNLGIYRDEYRREDGEWRFARRHLEMLYSGPPDLSAEPLPRESGS